MTVDMIETFLTILKYQNITAAAQKLYTNQSTVSHRLQMLEKEIGFPLFIRRKGQRVVELTPGGKEFIPIAERWMSLFRDTNQIQNQLMRQTLSIGGADLINTYTFLPLYERYLLDNREIQLNIRTYHSGELYHMLETRAIDMGYVYSRRHYPDILAELLYQESMYLICHRNSRYHPNMRPEDLQVEDEVYLRWNADFEMWHNRFWAAGKALLQVGTGAQLSLYLNVPNRWAIAPASVYQALRDKENIVQYTLTDSPPPLYCYEITHRYPKPGTVQIIQEFRKDVENFIGMSKSICRLKEDICSDS